jgi:predicted nucleic acid-binding Zn ribbon protein
MPLSPEDSKELKEILVTLFGSDAERLHPTSETLQLTEKMLLEIHRCHGRIAKLFNSLPCAMVGKGFLARCLRSANKVIKQNRLDFQGCASHALRVYRSPIFISGM